MGRHSTASEIFDNESKIDFGVPNTKSVEDVNCHPAGLGLGSSIQLFENQPTIEEQERIFGVQQWLIFICIIITALMDSFNATVLIPALPNLSNTFNKSLTSTFWANSVYLLFGATSQLYFTMMSEVFSHGPVWIIAMVLATIGTGICCGALSLVELIVGRMIQGIGGGGAMGICFAVMKESAPESIHSRYSCYILLTRMCGAMLGPVFGGFLIDYAHWTWAFYFNFVFCALGLLGIPFALDLRVSKNVPLRKLRTLDWSGVTMAFLGFGGIMTGLSWGGLLYRWSEWQTIVPMIGGAVIILALIFYQSKWSLHPQFGRKSFRSSTMVMTTYVGSFLHGFVIFAHMQFFPFYFISTHYMSTTLAGVTLLALIGFAIGPVAIAGVVLARELDCTQWIISGGWTLTALASGCSILLDNSTPTVAWVLLLFTAGLGHGLLLSGYNVRIQNIPKDGDGPLSTLPSTIAYYMRAWGWAFSVPVGGMVLLNGFGEGLTGIGLSRDLVNSLHGYLILMKNAGMTSEAREGISLISVAAFRVLWEVITGVTILGGISSAFLWRRRTSNY